MAPPPDPFPSSEIIVPRRSQVVPSQAHVSPKLSFGRPPPPNRITRLRAVSYAMSGAYRAEGLDLGASFCQLLPSHVQVSPGGTGAVCSVMRMGVPNRITRWRAASYVIRPSRIAGLAAGCWFVHPDPSHVQVSKRGWPFVARPPNSTTDFRLAS